MKICVISTPVFAVPCGGYAGLEVIAWQCAKGLAAKGHQVALVAPNGSTCPNAEIIPNGEPGTWDEKAAYGTYWQRLLEFDAVIDHSWSKWAYILKQEGKLKAPVLGVLHAPVNTMYQALPPVENPCMVCISQDQANHFNALFGRQAKVAYNGVDLDFYKPLGIPRTDRFLFLARFSTIKGPHLAIEACLKAGVGLDLIGDTKITGEPEYLAKCLSMADGKQIRIIGGVSRGEAVWWMSQAYAFIHPNRDFREPFGLAPVESLACGLPVIHWNFGALPETMGGRGYSCNSVKDLEDWIESNETMGIDETERRECRDQAKKFSIENMVNRYEELCQEALKTGGW